MQILQLDRLLFAKCPKIPYFYNMKNLLLGLLFLFSLPVFGQVTKIIDGGSTIKLFDGDTTYINKADIDRITSASGNTKIYMTGGKSYIMDETLVTVPAHTDEEDLALQIKDFLASGGSLAAGASTEAKQDAIIVEVTAIKLNVISIEGKVAEEVTQAANGVKLDNILAELVTINATSTLPREAGFLGTGGLNSGIVATGDFSVTPDDFFYEIPSGKTFLLKTLVIYIEDGNNSFNSGDYGGISALTNGIEVLISVDGVETSFLAGVLIKKNTDFSKHGAPLVAITFGTGNESGMSRVEIEDLTGVMLALNGDNPTPDRVIVRLNDDFTGLIDHSFKVFGPLIDN